jgi:outer membrane lipoprotein LolB
LNPARLITGLFLGLVLAACSTTRPLPGPASEYRAEYERRAALIASWRQWEFLGRLSIDDGSDGGSGSLSWQVREQSSQLDFRGTLGKGAWRLSIFPDRAVLERSDGSLAEAARTEHLVAQETGWQVPVDALHYWVRGLEAPGGAAGTEYDRQGRLTQLVQQSWTIEFDRYRATAGVDLPGRIVAVNGDLRLKLVVGRWQGPSGDG